MNEMTALDSMETYEAALKEILPYFESIPTAGRDAAVRFAILATRIKEFEDLYFPVEGSDCSPSG
jgi:antitoxin component HigA of HigAB toxin-antitoxin module